MPPKLKFSEGEKVLCFHGPLLYEAKCLKSTVSKEKNIKYLIHYAGWNKNWDEWVPESRVLKYNEANCQKMKEVQKAHSCQPTKSKKTPTKRKSDTADPKTSSAKSSDQNSVKDKEKDKDSESRASSPQQSEVVSQDSGSDVPRRKRSRLDLCIESEEQYLSKIEVKIKVPEELKSWIVDDWDSLVRQQKLANLPAKLTVYQILENYISQKRSSKSHNQQKELVIFDFINGIKEYFNATLGSQLLYKVERAQHAEIVLNYPNTPASKIYGAIHLLRLFLKIGQMLAYTLHDERSLQHIQTHIHDLLKYMVANRAVLFNLQEYSSSSVPEQSKKT